ncbi:hypothetical protein NIES21_14650 [Anabaenopsis circularis NIES-21]|uniref:Uncharacterized protein n=1 Tax=Anabaenopsis circularis NIES-21 TaxID=1085406 RepID=A0A1Z4GDU3_9CYAN|nr:hypothetical protein [Nostoc sp. PCC 7107]AFY45468.1 hypothetical protein Nos7107_4950 [Nostoc sp. PCC 7107]BAY15647.1 hypothetical protein NIES21_14650 [Anabaenopsis circularis NIES-21]
MTQSTHKYREDEWWYIFYGSCGGGHKNLNTAIYDISGGINRDLREVKEECLTQGKSSGEDWLIIAEEKHYLESISK